MKSELVTGIDIKSRRRTRVLSQHEVADMINKHPLYSRQIDLGDDPFTPQELNDLERNRKTIHEIDMVVMIVLLDILGLALGDHILELVPNRPIWRYILTHVELCDIFDRTVQAWGSLPLPDPGEAWDGWVYSAADIAALDPHIGLKIQYAAQQKGVPEGGVFVELGTFWQWAVDTGGFVIRNTDHD